MLQVAGGLLAVSGLVLLAGEGLARWLHRPQPVRRVYDPFAYRIPQPGLHDRYRNALGETVELRLNELGLRGPRLTEPLAPGTLTLAFLGGSAVENGAWNEDDTFPVIAARAAAQALGKPVRVWNGAASAATSATSLARLQHTLLDQHPDLVVVMDGINDLLAGFHPDYRRDGRHLPRPPVAGQQPRSFLFDWWRTRPFAQRRSPRRPPGFLQRLDYEHFAAREVFARNLRSLAAVAQAHAVPLLLVTQPTTYTPDAGAEALRRYYLTDFLAERGLPAPDVASLAAGMQAFNATTLEVARQVRAVDPPVRAFDLAAHVPRSFELFVDECHLTRAGNAHVARWLAPELERLLRLRSERGASVPPAR